jgi:hypothetical protein
VHGHTEPLGQLAVAQTVSDELQDLRLAWSQGAGLRAAHQNGC